MNRQWKKVLWAALLFFIFGASWGYWNQSKKRLAFERAAPLRVLCAEGWIPDSTLREFSARRNVSIVQWTYSNPNELLRQMANADGKIDVICTSSLLLRSLVNSHWIKKLPYTSLENAKYISVDFLHLPYDPDSEYSVPAHWTLYGFFGKGDHQTASSRQTLQSKKVSVWGDELNLLNLLARNGIRIEERLQDAETKTVENDVRKFMRSLTRIDRPTSAAVAAESLTSKVDWIQIPLSQVARLVGDTSPYRFWLPTDGGTVDVGLFAVGERSEHSDLALELINQLISTNQALEMHQHLGTSVVHASLSHHDSIAPLQKAEAIRQFPLTRYVFPDLSVDAIPRFQKLFSERGGGAETKN